MQYHKRRCFDVTTPVFFKYASITRMIAEINQAKQCNEQFYNLEGNSNSYLQFSLMTFRGKGVRQ